MGAVRFTQAEWLLLGLLLLLLVGAGALLGRLGGFDLRSRPLSDSIALALRALALALLLVALAGPQIRSRVDAHYVYFLVDRSASARAALPDEAVLQTLKGWAVPRPNTRYGLIVFGREAFVEAPFAPTLRPDALHTAVDPEGTNVAAALELALATFPPAGTRTIVLLSDGRATHGDLEGALARAARQGVPVLAVPLEAPLAEVAVQAVRAPREVAVGLPFVYRAVVHATRPAQAQLFVYRNGALLESREATLQPGLTVLEGRDRLDEPGLYEYRVELLAPEDALVQNNRARALVEAVGDPPILVVTEAEGNASPLLELLEGAGYAYTQIPLTELAPTPAALLPYRAVVLNDVPLRALTRAQIGALERYVRDLGGGLWVVQGRRAVEAFYDRELERLLPVTYEGPEELRRPALAIVLLLDRSGSMGETAGAYRKIDLLKRAAMEAVERLEGRNLVGILAFDARYEWIVPLGPVGGRKEAILEAIDELYPNGGTDVYEALQDAVERLKGVRARVKHILLFSDGKVARDRRNFERLFREIQNTTISASSIAIGPQADFEILGRLAEVGRGKLYPVRDARDLPEITLEEIVRVERARWIKGPVPVAPGPDAAALRSVDPQRVPPVGGYVLTFAKPAAQTPLVVRPDEAETTPLVSFWRYGLGKVLVLNTGLRADEGRPWLQWPELGDLLAELLGKVYSETAPTPEGLDVRLELQDDALTITVDAQRDGRWLDGLALEGRLSPPEGDPLKLSFEQVAPGRYRAVATDLKEGVYLLSVGEASLGWVKTAVSVPYPREYRRVGVDLEGLMRVAQATGGEYLEGLDPQGLVARLEGRAWAYRDLWPPLSLAALALFLLDLIARKLPLPSRER